MSRSRLLAVLLSSVSCGALAHDYPTVDRVEYVLECMKNNGGEYHYVYRCACVIDAISTELSYEAYVDASSVARYSAMGGERAGVLRDPEPLKDMAKRYRALQAKANQECGVSR
jgi:hypothetical protein